MMDAACIEACLSHLCAQVEANWQNADGMFLAMHGAGSAEGIDDLEAETLRRLGMAKAM